MGNANTALIIVCLIIITYQLHIIYDKKQHTIAGTTSQMYSGDGLIYKIYGKDPQALSTISEINNTLIDLIRILRNIYILKKMPAPNIPLNMGPYNDVDNIKQAVINIIDRYNPDNLYENSPHDPSGDTSYTYDKGKILAFCMRSKATGQIENIDVLKFVAIHELSHIGVEETDHSENYWFLFRFLLYIAQTTGLYTSPNFHKYPIKYCNGMKVSFNPLYVKIEGDKI